MKRHEISRIQDTASVRGQGVDQGFDLGRRDFFKLAGLGLTGFFVSGAAGSLPVAAQSGPKLAGTAKYVVFVHMIGAPSHLDTFDLKEGGWTPKDFEPTSYGGVRWPKGLMPKLGDQLGKAALVRSMNAWALVHPLAQQWAEIGRNPTSGLSKIAPNIGSVVAYEFEGQRTEKQKLPGFVALNTGNGIVRQGYFSPEFAPFTVTTNPAGLANSTHPEGQERFNARYGALTTMDKENREKNPFGQASGAMATAYNQARDLMYNPDIQKIFQYSTDELQKFGNTGFGAGCLTARNLIQANAGTRFIQLNLGSWDHHANIYNANAGIYPLARAFDNGIGQLMTDLAATPSSSGKTLLDETLIVAMGEFGRTPGNLNNQAGRDHYLQMSAFLAGAGIKGGRVIGKTDDTGAGTIETGWSRDMIIRPEDVFATIYSALGIDYTKVLHDDPFNRGFEYVPYAKDGGYAAIDELW